MNKRVRIKRRSEKDDSPISPLMQDYVNAVVDRKTDGLREELTVVHADLRLTYLTIRIMYTVLVDLQSSANLAASNTGASKQILREFIENMQSSLGHNVGLLTRIQMGADDVTIEDIVPVFGLIPQIDELEHEAVAAVLENLRAQAARSAEGDDFDEGADMIENAMGDVDGHVDLTRDETDGERLLRRIRDNEVRSTRRPRPTAGRGRST